MIKYDEIYVFTITFMWLHEKKFLNGGAWGCVKIETYSDVLVDQYKVYNLRKQIVNLDRKSIFKSIIPKGLARGSVTIICLT